jgi:hypothetical protein
MPTSGISGRIIMQDCILVIIIELCGIRKDGNMSKLTNIKNKINQLEGGAFQEFCDQYLARKGYDYIFELGMKSGTMKTTTGNPDTYFKSKSGSGKYIFVVYTTQQASINVKIEEDIRKCLDKSKTGVDICDIGEIICCHTSSTLNAGKDKELHEICEKKGILLSLYGIDRIANDVYQYFPILAKDFLGISIDTNQTSDIGEFISRYDSNEMAAPLATNFQFRYKELENMVAAIENSKVVVVFGKAGVGKTRIVIEASRRFSEQNAYRLLCIRSNDLPIFEDLASYIPMPGNYLVFIDDANELNGFKYVLRYLNMAEQGYNIKIIATVRDYARKYVIDQIKEFTMPVKIEIDKFSDDEIRKLLEENLKIKNDLYLDQIVKIAEGNPRIAFLSGKLAKDNQKLESIQDATQLYEMYYGKYINTSIISTDDKVCLSAGIIALLGTVNLEHLDKLEIVFNMINMNKSEFITNLKLLHSMEFIEINYDKAAHISDQCLSNYMLYYTFFERKLIPFSEILDIGFKDFRSGIIRGVNILLNIFQSEQSQTYIKKEVEKVWDKYKKEDNELFFDFVKVFHGFKPVESLLYVQQKIECTQKVEANLNTINFDENSGGTKDEILLILADYRYSVYISEALELIIMYCQKRQDIIAEVADTLITYFGVDKYSYRNDYYTLKNVVKVLSEHCEDNQLMKNLFINVSGKLLALCFSSTELSRENKFVLYKIPVQLTDGSREYRSNLWNKLIKLSEYAEYKDKILKIITEYSQGWYEEIDSKVIEFDFPYIEHLIKNVYEVSVIRTAKTCDQLIKKCKHYSIIIDNKFEDIFKSQEWLIYSTLSEKYYGNGISYEQGVAKRKSIIAEYAKNYDEEKLNEFVYLCNNIVGQLSNEAWGINEGIRLFCQALEFDRNKYLTFINSYFIFGRNLNVYPGSLIVKLFDYLGVDKTFSFITDKDYIQKNVWMFAFFEVLPQEEVSNRWIEEFMSFLKNDDDKAIKSSPYRQLRFLDKYTMLRPKIYIDVAVIINEKFKYSSFIPHIYFGLLFDENVYKPIEIINIFKDNMSLLQDIYFKMIDYDIHEDYSGVYIKAFIENDETWLTLYIQHVINNEKSVRYSESDRISACWLSDKYQQIFDKIFYELEKVDDFYKWSLKIFFRNILLHRENEQEKMNNQTNWLIHIISDNCKDEKIVSIFDFISELGPDVRKECVVHFIKLNKDYEMFEKLELESNYWGGEGSMIPYMEQRIRFYKSLLPYFTGLELLKHKKLLLENIEMWKRRIEKEQIKEILEERIS